MQCNIYFANPQSKLTHQCRPYVSPPEEHPAAAQLSTRVHVDKKAQLLKRLPSVSAIIVQTTVVECTTPSTSL